MLQEPCKHRPPIWLHDLRLGTPAEQRDLGCPSLQCHSRIIERGGTRPQYRHPASSQRVEIDRIGGMGTKLDRQCRHKRWHPPHPGTILSSRQHHFASETNGSIPKLSRQQSTRCRIDIDHLGIVPDWNPNGIPYPTQIGRPILPHDE
jgi:hypothetical protein